MGSNPTLSAIGLQVLIAAPTEKRAVVYENLDTIIDVHRFGDDVSAETSYIKEKARTAMREAKLPLPLRASTPPRPGS